MELMANLKNSCIFFSKYLLLQGCRCDCCEQWCVLCWVLQDEIKADLSPYRSLNYKMNAMSRAMYQFQWGQWMSCLSRHRMKSQYFGISSCGMTSSYHVSPTDFCKLPFMAVSWWSYWRVKMSFMKPLENTWNTRAWADLSLHEVVHELKTLLSIIQMMEELARNRDNHVPLCTVQIWE